MIAWHRSMSPGATSTLSLLRLRNVVLCFIIRASRTLCYRLDKIRFEVILSTSSGKLVDSRLDIEVSPPSW